MAKRRRRRRTATRAAAAPRRRRRRRVHRNPGALARARRNPPTRRTRRRRRLAVATSRRRFRRNPGISASGLVGGIVQGLKDGGAVVLGQVGARKVRGAVTGMLPATVQTQLASGMGKIALSLASAVVVSLVARKALPGQSRMISAGAFSETINQALAATPIAPFLSAYPGGRRALPVQAGNVLPGGRRAALSAWTAPRQVGMSAYPTGGTMRSVGMPVSAGIL